MDNIQKQEAVVFHNKNEERGLQTVQFVPEKKGPEERKYLVLIYFLDGAEHEEDHTFILATGRTDTYFEIKSMIQDVDINKSIVILEGKRALVEGEYVSVSAFLRHIRDNELIHDETGYEVDEVLVEEE